jgi:hypothetical protein
MEEAKGFEEPGEDAARSGFDRRTFVKRVAVTTAFVAPAVTSLSLSGVNSVFAQAAAASNTPNTIKF